MQPLRGLIEDETMGLDGGRRRRGVPTPWRICMGLRAFGADRETCFLKGSSIANKAGAYRRGNVQSLKYVWRWAMGLDDRDYMRRASHDEVQGASSADEKLEAFFRGFLSRHPRFLVAAGVVVAVVILVAFVMAKMGEKGN